MNPLMGGKWAEWAEESNTHKLMKWRKRERGRERERERERGEEIELENERDSKILSKSKNAGD